MMFPDGRNDAYYNQEFLDGQSKEWLKGFDYAVEMIESFFSNLDVYDDMDDIFADKKAVIMEGKAEKTCACMKEHMESKRDEVITSMIDGMDDELYQALRNKYLAEHSDADFYDTRDFKEVAKRSVE